MIEIFKFEVLFNESFGVELLKFSKLGLIVDHRGCLSSPRTKDDYCRLDVEIYVESMGNYQPKTMDFDMDVYFIQHWRDQRLWLVSSQVLVR